MANAQLSDRSEKLVAIAQKLATADQGATPLKYAVRGGNVADAAAVSAAAATTHYLVYIENTTGLTR